MQIKYTFPIVGDLHLAEHWPLQWDKYRLDWVIEGENIVAVTISVCTKDPRAFPQITTNPQPGISANITLNDRYRDEVEQVLRSMIGFLGFFAEVWIDFERPSRNWEAETEEEAQHLPMQNFSLKKSHEKRSQLPISYDVVARAFFGASAISHSEVLLSFAGKGRRDLEAGRYIDAFYSFFFFLETQFAPGYSDPRVVNEKLKAAPALMNAFDEARKLCKIVPPSPPLAALLRKSDVEIIEYLVETRGRLHHHALPRKVGKWHPDKHREFEAAADILRCLVHVIVHETITPPLFSDAVTKECMEAAKKEGAVQKYVVSGQGRYRAEGDIKSLPILRLNVFGRKPSHFALNTIQENLHTHNRTVYKEYEVFEYDILSEDGTQVFARYRNHVVNAP